MAAYALTIFIGAFLLFQVQPLIGKSSLPWFGGAPAVWTTCMLFFQVLLLGGYGYAHLTARWLKPRGQALLHLALLVCALALLPVTPADTWKPEGSENPTLRILGLLLASLGLPYFVLSSTGPLLQHWFSRTNPGVSPFRLYALSNAGSLLALVSFPFFFETQFTRTTQARLWGWGLVAYALGCAWCAIKFARPNPPAFASGYGEAPPKRSAGGQPSTPTPALDPRPSTLAPRPSTFGLRSWWLALPACASVLLLATTNRMCQEVAVIPFLWVLPLALYLLSFIVAFDSPRWYKRLPYGVALVVCWAAVCWALFWGAEAPILSQLVIYSATLFVCCMICHGELYRLRPDPRHLTGFYLMIAAGGALGGFLVAVVAPVVFSDYHELQWGLVLCGLLFVAVCVRHPGPAGLTRPRLAGVAAVSVSLVALGAGLWMQAHQLSGSTVHKSRNFYGVLKVLAAGPGPSEWRYLKLRHGRILHGMQFTEPPRKPGCHVLLHAPRAAPDWPSSAFPPARAGSASSASASAPSPPMRNPAITSASTKSIRRSKPSRNRGSPTCATAPGRWMWCSGRPPVARARGSAAIRCAGAGRLQQRLDPRPPADEGGV